MKLDGALGGLRDDVGLSMLGPDQSWEVPVSQSLREEHPY
jgi:hypothetical protein